MKKLISIILFVCMLISVPLWAVEFGVKSDFKVTYDDKVLTVVGKNVTLKVSDSGDVKKLVPERWETITSGGVFLTTPSGWQVLATTATWYTSPVDYDVFESKVVGPYTVDYSRLNKMLVISTHNTIQTFPTKITPFVLRVQTCGMVEKLEWKEINKNQE